MTADSLDPRQPRWMRALSRDLVRDILTCGDDRFRVTVERLTEHELAELQAAYDARTGPHDLLGEFAPRLAYDDHVVDLRARIAELRAQASPYVAWLRAFEQRRCRRLCCPALAPHDRTHPLCVVRPALWQDDGDQA